MAQQRESFPRLDLVAAKSAMDKQPASVCVFSLAGKIVGQLFLADIEDDFVIVSYLFAARDVHCEETQAVLRTIQVKNPLDRFRRFFLCPGCNEARRDLYYSQSWACAGCLGLLYRSQLVDKEVRLWEERDQLHAVLKAGRPKGMHNRTYFERRLRLAALERRLYGRQRKVASDEHDAIMTERWIPARDIDLWSCRYRVLRDHFDRIED